VKVLSITLALIISSPWANGAILRIGASDVLDLNLQQNESLRCRNSSQEFAFELKLTTGAGTFHRAFCADASDRRRWEMLYSDLLKLVSGISSEVCLLSETCNYWGCEKVYGKTKVDLHNVIAITSASHRIEDYQVNLQIGCYK
jgi:hypothetical protein